MATGLLLLLSCGCANFKLEHQEENAFQGPMPYRSIMPLSLVFPHPIQEKSDLVGKGKTSADWNTLYGSVMVRDGNGPEAIAVDGEFLRTSLYVKHGLNDYIEVGGELPFVHYTSGFLDSTIENFHDMFGFPQGKRDRNPDDQYAAMYSNQYGPYFKANEDGMHLTDIPLYLKIGVLDETTDVCGLALRGTLELPTGNDSAGYGNGGLDSGVGLIWQKRLMPFLACYVNVDHIMRYTPSDFRGVEAANVTHGSLAFESAFTDRFSMVAQTDYQTRPLIDHTKLSEVSQPEWSFTMGLGYRAGETARVKFFFSEGLTTRNAPDFVFGLSLGMVF